jgi:large subunit ribosomal protein L19
MFSLIQAVEAKYKRPAIVDVKSGDTVRVHQRIQEGSKTRIQIFEGLIIRTRNMGSLNASILTRRIASGVGVEKGFLLHSPLIEKIEVIKRSKVRRNYLSYMRERQGKSARLSGVDFDREAVNKANEVIADAPEVPIDESQAAREAEAALAVEHAAEAAHSETAAESPEPNNDKVDAKPSAKKEKADNDKEDKPGQPADTEDDKAAAKKAKAEAFRQSQVAKK